MRITLRAIALLLCLVLLGASVSAAEPSFAQLPAGGEEPSASAAELRSDTPVEAEPQDDPPADPEPEEPPADPEPEEPPVDPEPEEPPVDPEPEEPPVEPEPEIPVWEMSDQQIIDKFHIADDWARDPLIFAVRNRLMTGKGNDDLAPLDNTTHAELGMIIVCLLRTTKEADLSRFTDVLPGTWYYKALAQLVSLKIYPLADPDATTLSPDLPITREEAFVAIARALGVHGSGRQAIYRFSDWRDVSDWAAEDIAALIDASYIAGSDGKILPKQNITRRELAAVLFQLLTKVDSSVSGTFTGRLALGSDQIAPGTTINGDLILSTDHSSLTLENVKVTGRLVLQGNGWLNLQLNNCSIGTLVVCRSCVIQSNTALNRILVHASCRLGANAACVQVYKPFIVLESATVTTLDAVQKVNMTVNGKVTTLNVLGNGVYINGSGRIHTLNVRGRALYNYCAADNVVEDPLPSLYSVTGTRVDNAIVTDGSPTVNMKVKLANMPQGWSECDLIWKVEGQEVGRSSRNLLKEGSVITQSYNFFPYLDCFHETASFTVDMIIEGKQRQVFNGSVTMDADNARLARSVRTQNVQGTIKESTTLYANMNLTGAIKTVAAGTQVTILQSRNTSYTKIRLSDGSSGWVKYSLVDVSSERFYTTSDYTKELKEYYVNQYKKWGSSKSYLIWVSLYTQRINIFKGYKGHWTLIQSGPIASGRNSCPTPVENTTILYKPSRWEYRYYYCDYVSVFDEARGLHSRPKYYDTGAIYDYTIGRPASAGCVRLMDSECAFIYNSVPVGTAVYIY